MRPTSRSDVTFVLCIEQTGIRAQALLLGESIRAFTGAQCRAPIVAIAPRPGLGVDRTTRQRLAALDVAYAEEPLNTCCPEYASANRVFAAAWAERQASTEWVMASSAAASEYWGSNQTALAIAIWAMTDRVHVYPPSYNVPLHLIAERPAVIAGYRQAGAVHVHYHWLFAEPHDDRPLDTLTTLGAESTRLAWIAERLPLASH